MRQSERNETTTRRARLKVGRDRRRTHVGAVVLSGDKGAVLDEDDISTLEELLGSRSGVVSELEGELGSNGKTSGGEVGLVDASAPSVDLRNVSWERNEVVVGRVGKGRVSHDQVVAVAGHLGRRRKEEASEVTAR